jgi:hypothetical protein
MSTPTFEPDTVGSTIVEERVESEYRYDPGDEERFAHYAERDKIMEASVFGTPLTALCGKVWVPSRDPSRFPVCPECKEIFEGLDRGGDDGDSGDGGTN